MILDAILILATGLILLLLGSSFLVNSTESFSSKYSISGFVASFFVCPLEYLKIQQQQLREENEDNDTWIDKYTTENPCPHTPFNTRDEKLNFHKANFIIQKLKNFFFWRRISE